MIRLNKHDTVRQNVVYASFVVASLLKRRRVATYDEIRKKLSKEIDGGEFLMIDTLCFMYALGMIRYHAENDMLEIIRHETK